MTTAVTKNATYRTIPHLEGYSIVEYDVTGATGYVLDASGEFSTIKSAMFVGTTTMVICTFSGPTDITLGTITGTQTGVVIVRGSLLKK